MAGLFGRLGDAWNALRGIERAAPAVERAVINTADEATDLQAVATRLADDASAFISSRGGRSVADDVAGAASRTNVQHSLPPQTAMAAAAQPVISAITSFATNFKKASIGIGLFTAGFVWNPVDNASSGGIINGTLPNLQATGALPESILGIPLDIPFIDLYTRQSVAYQEGLKSRFETARDSQNADLSQRVSGAYNILGGSNETARNAIYTRISAELTEAGQSVGVDALRSTDNETRQAIAERLFSVTTPSAELMAYRKRFAEAIGVTAENPGLTDVQTALSNLAEQRTSEVQRAQAERNARILNERHFGASPP